MSKPAAACFLNTGTNRGGSRFHTKHTQQTRDLLLLLSLHSPRISFPPLDPWWPAYLASMLNPAERGLVCPCGGADCGQPAFPNKRKCTLALSDHPIHVPLVWPHRFTGLTCPTHTCCCALLSSFPPSLEKCNLLFLYSPFCFVWSLSGRLCACGCSCVCVVGGAVQVCEATFVE